MMIARMLAQMTQEDVFRSISASLESGGGGAGSGGWILLSFAALMLLLLVAIARRRQGGSAGPKRLRHPGKLQREIVRKVGLKSGELKKLKSLAEEVDASSPLLLLLCPSLMAEAARKRRER